MTDSMIERVARAIYEHAIDAPDWEALEAPAKGAYIDHARAAIEAMREPTDAIVRAHHVVPDDTDFRERAADNWRNLIDAALKD